MANILDVAEIERWSVASPSNDTGARFVRHARAWVFGSCGKFVFRSFKMIVIDISRFLIMLNGILARGVTNK